MKDKLVKSIKTKPVFILLLPVFFVLHGFMENFNFIPLKDAAFLTLVYTGSSLALAILFWFLFHNQAKATLAAFAFMAFNLFFGSGHDFLKEMFPNSFIIKYSFILPTAFILACVFIIYLKKTKRNFTKTTTFLNWLFLLLILIDIGTLLFKVIEKPGISVAQLSKEFISCDTCSRPDIYLIIADEYAGKAELKDVFAFNNSEFENELRNRGFHIVNDSKANYNASVYSMASMLNMDYLKNLKSNTINQHDILVCRDLIKKNNLLYILQKKEYDIYNNSFFDLNNKQRLVINFFFPSMRKLINSQTFINRFNMNLGFHFATQQKLENIKKNNLYNNKKIDSLTRIIALKKSIRPKFVYTHLSMPHHPYYFDKNGKEVKYEMLTENYIYDKNAYIEYLLYTNKKLLELVDYIKKASSNPPIIILMGDHGFRQFTDSADKKYQFMNLNFIYFPNGNYSLFYDGMSNVNQFRVILNSQFGQKLSMLKDSISFLSE